MTSDTSAGLVERLRNAIWLATICDTTHSGTILHENHAAQIAVMAEAAQRIADLEAALEAETERCAKFAERFPPDPRSPRAIADGLRRAAAIRAGAGK